MNRVELPLPFWHNICHMHSTHKVGYNKYIYTYIYVLQILCDVLCVEIRVFWSPSKMPTEQTEPNLCGQQQLSGWMRHRVSSSDTVAHLALKYGTTMGRICRANRMYWPDILQTRSYIWVPTVGKQCDPPPVDDRTQPLREARSVAMGLVSQPNYGSLATMPPHFYRQSAPNLDDFAGDCDPLLITMRCM